ncbi:UNVERIFIED_CONTAM: hypothetical protein FKN15_045547 [Acipenser sinensis]
MTFSVALCILICPGLAQKQNDYARQLLTFFVAQGSNLYGQEFLVYNVHSMVHLASDANKYGSLDNCSSFPFENYLQQLKCLVRSGKNPLAQIVKRLGELESFQTIEPQHVQKIQIKRPNNAYVHNDTVCCEVTAITHEKDDDDNTKMLLCRVFERVEPYFTQLCDSRIIGCYKAHLRDANMKICSAKSIIRRAMMIEKDHESQVVFFAILHEF